MEDLKTALNILDNELRPASQERVVMKLGTLKALTASRAGSTDDMEFQIMALVEEISQYPDKAVDYAYYHLKNNQWFPTWSEWKNYLDMCVEQTVFAKQAIENAILRNSQ